MTRRDSEEPEALIIQALTKWRRTTDIGSMRRLRVEAFETALGKAARINLRIVESASIV